MLFKPHLPYIGDVNELIYNVSVLMILTDNDISWYWKNNWTEKFSRPWKKIWKLFWRVQLDKKKLLFINSFFKIWLTLIFLLIFCLISFNFLAFWPTLFLIFFYFWCFKFAFPMVCEKAIWCFVSFLVTKFLSFEIW